MRKYEKALSAFILLLTFFSSCAPLSQEGVRFNPDTIDPVKKASRSVVAIWDPELHRASLSGVYGGLKGPIGILAAGVVIQREGSSILILTAYRPEKPVTLEFIEDRSFVYMPIDQLLRGRVVSLQDAHRFKNGISLLLKIMTDKTSVSPVVNRVEIAENYTGTEERNAFMVINYLGRPELAIWGKVKNGVFFEKSGLIHSFAVPGSPVFDMHGHLIGLFTKNGRLLFVR